MDTDLKNEMLVNTLATMIADTEHIHVAHAVNRVRLAVEIAGRAVNAPTATERAKVVANATRIDGRAVSDATRNLVNELLNAYF